MKILIAIPCMDTVPVAFVESLMALRHPDWTPCQVSVRFMKNSLIYDARNLLSLTAMKEDFDYVLWLDSDMIVPQDALIRLLKDEQTINDARMITGLYVKRTFPTEPVLYSEIHEPIKVNGSVIRQILTYTDYLENDQFPVAGCGFGCVLTEVSLLREVWDRFGPAFAPFPWASEDISFCWRVNHLKDIPPQPPRIWCDSNVSCGHIGSFLFTEKMLKRGDNT